MTKHLHLAEAAHNMRNTVVESTRAHEEHTISEIQYLNLDPPVWVLPASARARVLCCSFVAQDGLGKMAQIMLKTVTKAVKTGLPGVEQANICVGTVIPIYA